VTRRRAVIAAGALAAVWVALQVTAPRRTNPSVDKAASLDAALTPPIVMSVLRRSCFDCHSSETRWPAYASIAPMSWLVVSDVNEGRGQLNFSRWNDYNVYDRADLLDKICENVSARTMPLWQYRLIHPSARLSDTEMAAICAWTDAEVAKSLGAK